MGRRYDSAAYARVVERARAALPGAAIHADVIVGFPTEDEAAFVRSWAFIRDLDLAGLHVFRYSARPGTPATRMAGQVPDQVRRERAAELLTLAAASRRSFASRAIGGHRAVLLEVPDPAGGWVGHAEDYVLVRVANADGQPLEGEIARVAVDDLDPVDPERVIGHVVGLARRPLRRVRFPATSLAEPLPSVR
jgi:threonylcarbamoyladenosine tRNA methylthiotransferase MtaB